MKRQLPPAIICPRSRLAGSCIRAPPAMMWLFTGTAMRDARKKALAVALRHCQRLDGRNEADRS